MDNMPAENFVVCCLTVSCRTHCPCSIAHSLILQCSSCPWALRELYLILQSRKTHCKLWNGIIGFPVDEVVGRPVCYSLKKFFHCLSKISAVVQQTWCKFSKFRPPYRSGLANEFQSYGTVPKACQEFNRTNQRGYKLETHQLNQSHTVFFPHSNYQETSREDGRQVNIHKKAFFFFSFLTLNKPAILTKASSFSINFLLKVFCVPTLLHIRLKNHMLLYACQ